MSVFTKVTSEQLSGWLSRYPLGTLVELKGIASGIENTNYFVTTTSGRYVLTLFERLSEAELPFYLNLMAHLAGHAIPCPAPIADCDRALLGHLNGKPATLVTCLPGRPVMAPAAHHCMLIGAALARLHAAGQSYGARQDNPRGPHWWQETAPRVIPFLDEPRQALLQSELDAQLAAPAMARREALPSGPVHADLFRDNALWEGADGQEKLGGIIDFYFAGVDALLFDVAVTVNDWCVLPDGGLDAARCAVLLDAYGRERSFTADERAAWPLMLRAAALRFWLSRLYDFYLPRPGELTHAHDPEHFRRVLEQRRAGVPALV
ncbi:MAG TPA: homoserine kinase [Burkholderiales bacterium]|nr:homoserine kinase [Burkholderiales bacterium]